MLRDRLRPKQRLGVAVAALSLAACADAASARQARCGDLEQAIANQLETLLPLGAMGGVLVVDAPGLGRIGTIAGVADERGSVLSRAHAFQIGSQTKMFTAAAIVGLANRGVIDLDDPVSRWVHGVAQPETITVRHLLNHTSGLGDGVRRFDTPGTPPNGPVTFAELARWSALEPSQFAPGEGFAYNNFGFDILGEVIAGATGGSRDTHIDNALTGPLGLRDTYSASPSRWPERIAHGYQDVGGVRADLGAPRDLSWAYAAGDMVSTADAMIALMRALAGDQEEIDVGFSDLSAGFVSVPDDSDMPRYGFGLMERRFGNFMTWGHGGFIHGYVSYSGVVREQDVAFSIMTNLKGDPDFDAPSFITALSKVVGQTLILANTAAAAGEMNCGT